MQEYEVTWPSQWGENYLMQLDQRTVMENDKKWGRTRRQELTPERRHLGQILYIGGPLEF